MTLLKARFVQKPWGCIKLPPPFTNTGSEPIGEIWFEPPKVLDALLVKYIFTNENLSVQCHPSDAQTLRKGLGRQGKEECWLVIDAEPDARLGIGFSQPIDSEAMRRAALDGSIEQLLTWHTVKPGDFFYIPANTVHAIGAGISLIEIQQNSNITYRLYDYERPRELHLDEGIGVANGGIYATSHRRLIPKNGSVTMVDGPFFRLDRLHGPPDKDTLRRYGQAPTLLLPLDCTVSFSNEEYSPAQCCLINSLDVARIPEDGRCLIAQPFE